MSVAEFMALRARLFEEARAAPECWGLMGNSVWGKAEDYTLIALFDTREAAEVYLAASTLLGGLRTKDKIQRAFRPDSLLWDYNPMVHSIGRLTTSVLSEHGEIDNVPHNPRPPSGDLEEVLAPYKAEVVAEALL